MKAVRPLQFFQIQSDYPDETFAEMIINSLLTIIESNHSKNRNKNHYTTQIIANIKIKDYLLRIMQYMTNDAAIHIMACIYLNRYLEKYPENFLNEYNVHRLLACCVLLSYKLQNDDAVLSFDFLSRVLGIPKDELAELEAHFFSEFESKCNLFITPEDFQITLRNILGPEFFDDELQSNSFFLPTARCS